MKTPPLVAWLMACSCLLLAACDYAAPITPKPTRKVDARLLGNWAGVSNDDRDNQPMHVRQWDDTHYAVSIEDAIYRVHHSDIASLPLISARDLNSSHRHYAFFSWALSADGAQLTLRRVRTEVIPESTPATEIQQLITDNAGNPQLFGAPLLFTRLKAE